MNGGKEVAELQGGREQAEVFRPGNSKGNQTAPRWQGMPRAAWTARWRWRVTRGRRGQKGREGSLGRAGRRLDPVLAAVAFYTTVKKTALIAAWTADWGRAGGGVLQEVRAEVEDPKGAQDCGPKGMRMAWSPRGGGRAVLGSLAEGSG